MSKKKKDYKALRWTTIMLTTLMLPFGTFVGFQFGAGRTKFALMALAVQTGLTIIQAHIWWLTLEKVKS